MPIELFPPMTLDQGAAWFGTKTSRRFNPDGRVTQLWWQTSNFPELESVDETGAVDFYHFADGTVFRRVPGEAPSLVTAPAGGGLPDGIDGSLVAQWFGTASNDGQEFRFDPNDEVCQLWLGLGRYPRLTWVDDFGGRLYFRFADGTVIYRSAPDASFRVLGAKTGDGLYPDGMDAGLAEQWFGDRFSETGRVSRLWLKVGQERKRFPAYLGSDQLPNGQFFRFGDGMVFFREQPADDPVLFPVPEQTRGTTVGGSLPIERIWGEVPYHLTQEHGMTPFSQDEGAHFYGYTLLYCRDWCEPLADPNAGHCPEIHPSRGAGHPGLDIGIGFGTKLFTPVAGKVICEGTERGLEGCGAFPCDPGSGNPRSGRFELELENGDRLIYGHMAEITVRAGDVLKAGDEVGSSGRDNGDHVHIEYRQRFPECRAGNPYLLVDPQDKFSKLK